MRRVKKLDIYCLWWWWLVCCRMRHCECLTRWHVRSMSIHVRISNWWRWYHLRRIVVVEARMNHRMMMKWHRLVRMRRRWSHKTTWLLRIGRRVEMRSWHLLNHRRMSWSSCSSRRCLTIHWLLSWSIRLLILNRLVDDWLSIGRWRWLIGLMIQIIRRIVAVHRIVGCVVGKCLIRRWIHWTSWGRWSAGRIGSKGGGGSRRRSSS